MKTLTTLTAVAALIAGLSIASAQNAPTTTPNTSPNAANKGSQPDTPSGARGSQGSTGPSMSGQSKSKMGATAGMKYTGTGKFCIETSPGGASMNCKFASMEACQKEAKPNNFQCVPRAAGRKTSGKAGAK